MKFIHTKLDGCYIIEPKIIKDESCHFMEIFNENTFQKRAHQDVYFVQDNQSFSIKRIPLGLHYQTGSHSQAKLVRFDYDQSLGFNYKDRDLRVTYSNGRWNKRPKVDFEFNKSARGTVIEPAINLTLTN